MTVPVLTQDQFIDLFKENGCTINTDFWEKTNVVIIEKGDKSHPVECMQKYFFPIVVQYCWMLDINPPEDHLHSYLQVLSQKPDSLCPCGSGKPFVNCHQKQLTKGGYS